jgi:enamine deaminase RidA (YjgF/YER057c/UK114 family)
MLKKINPPSIVEPFNNAYHHVVVVPPNARLAYISGQIGLRPDGSLPATVEEQADQAWSNVMEALKAAGMGSSDIVKVTAYLIEESEYSAFAAARQKYIGEARPASTAVLVKQLVSSEWRVEIDIVAAAE